MELKLKLSEVVGKGYKSYWESRHRYRIIIGGRGSKKSTTAALWHIANMIKYRDANTLVIRKIDRTHKDSTFAQLIWAINKLGVSSLWKVKFSPLELILTPTGQKILFRGLDDPMSITSITVSSGYLCWVWFEEFFQVNKESDFDMIDLGIRGDVPEPLFKSITGTMNPWNEKHWIKARFFDKHDSDTFTQITTYKQNEFLGKDDIALFDKMMIQNPRRYKVEGLGEWGTSEGLIYDNWEERNFDKDKLISENPKLQSGFGLDFGYTTDPTAFVCFLVDRENKEIYVYDEHYQKGMLNNQIADMIKYKGYAKEEIIADSSEPKSIEEIKRNGVLRIKPAAKGRDSVNNGIQFVKQFRLIVHPSCLSTILELNNYSWKDNRAGEKINEPNDDYNHILDALRYGLEKFQREKVIKATKSL